MIRQNAYLVLGLSVSLAGWGDLRAQGEPVDCEAAAARLSAGRATRGEVQTLGSCARTGPVALAQAWGRQGAGRTEGLVEATAALRDDRLLATTMGVARAGGPADDRLAALQVLAQYYDVRLAPSKEFLTSDGVGSPIPRRYHYDTTQGSSPLRAGAPTEIAGVFAQLTADLDPTVRGAALRLRQSLAISDPGRTPLRPGSIALVAGCGSRVTLRSTADVDVVVQLRVDGTTFSGDYGIVAGTASKPTNRVLSLPKGTVVAAYGGREVARLAKRDAPCPPGLTRHP